jgi:phospholipase A-2-activating protein
LSHTRRTPSLHVFNHFLDLTHETLLITSVRLNMSSSTDPAPYRLRAELLGHDADVRGVAASRAGIFATGSRDSTAAVWALPATVPAAVLRGHDHFVNAVAFSAPHTLLTASSDGSIRVWAVAEASAECTNVLKGHKENVCDIAVLGAIAVSSSWDMTARVWDLTSGECMRVLRGHEAAVWAALPMADGRVVTVAADKTIRVWSAMPDSQGHTVLPPVHTDVVRAISPGPNGGFVTVSNDSSAVYWAPNSATGGFDASAHLPDLHDGSFSYSVSGMAHDDASSWLFATGGEDNAARIVHADVASGSLSCVQTIMHPGVVWSVALAANSDVITGCSDGVARVFTRDPTLAAEPEVIAAFEKSVSERQLNTKVIGGVDMAKLPNADDALTVPGTKDGENKIVKTAAGAAEVHMWSAAEVRWTKVGDVVDGPGGASGIGAEKGVVKGRSYDFVFEVELGAGGKNKKLGYNRGENPYDAAQRFIDDNELNQDFLDQIASFVEQQVPSDALPASNGIASDPLTGGSRYVPGRAGGLDGASHGRDPLTGSSGYRAGSSNRNGGSGGGGPSSLPLPPPRKQLPHPTGLVSYTTSELMSKIQTKIAEFNTQLATQGSDLVLTQDEAAVFGGQLMPKLKSMGSTESIVFTDEECAVVDKLCTWPTNVVFPVLDVARLVIVRPSGGAYFFGKQNGVLLDKVMQHMSSPDASTAVLIMGSRFMCNMFGNRVVASTVRSRCSEILKAASGASKSDNRRARETHATLLINYAYSMYSTKADAEERAVPLGVALALLTGGERDEEVGFRLLTAVGTLMCGGDEYAAKGLELGAATAAALVAPASARMTAIALEIATLIAK